MPKLLVAPFSSSPHWQRGSWLLLLLGVAPAAFGQAFSPFVAYPTGDGSQPTSVALADVNNDGRPDIVNANAYTNASTHSVGVRLGSGNGTFQAAVTYDSKSAVYDVAVADVNGDSKPDVLTGNSDGTVGVLLGNGNGTFQPSLTSSAGGGGSICYSVAVADVNGDNKPDVITTNRLNGTIGVLLGNGNGTFQTGVNYRVTSTGGGFPNDAVVADVNGDGKPDIIVANGSENAAGVLLGNGNGTFQAVVNYPAGTGYNSEPESVAVGDISGDGKPDIITANGFTNVVGVFLGNGNGTFQAVVTYDTGYNSFPTSVVLADMNSDGKLDIVTANYGDSSVGVLLGKGTGTFQPIVSFSTGRNSNPRILAVADVNGDQKSDIATANYTNNTVTVLLNATVLAARSGILAAPLTLWPNPCASGVLLSLRATDLPADARSLVVSLLNPVGQLVTSSTLPVAQGTLAAGFPMQGVARGLYLLRLSAQNAQGQLIGSLPAQHLCVE